MQYGNSLEEKKIKVKLVSIPDAAYLKLHICYYYFYLLQMLYVATIFNCCRCWKNNGDALLFLYHTVVL